MESILGQALIRRILTIPIVYASLIILTILLPLVLPVAALIDLFRWARARTHAMALRITVFAWVYLLGQAWAIIALAVLGLLPRSRSIAWTYAAQRAWLDWNFVSIQQTFALRFFEEGSAQIPPGPILLLSRHASLIDTMLPARYVVKPHGIKLRYVLKKELLIDPALDIGGNRLPNHFLDRMGDTNSELAAVRSLATDLGDDEGVLIYPEGTRYSDEKRARYARTWQERDDSIAAIAADFARVLPPRPAGTLALLEASSADVVVLAHRGLEGFATVRDMWSGGLVGSRVDLEFRRIRRSEIPEDREARIKWLFELWAEVDAWVQGQEALKG